MKFYFPLALHYYFFFYTHNVKTEWCQAAKNLHVKFGSCFPGRGCVKLGKLHCPDFFPTRHHSRLSGCHHSLRCSCSLVLFVLSILKCCWSQVGCRTYWEAGWLNNNKEAGWAYSEEEGRNRWCKSSFHQLFSIWYVNNCWSLSCLIQKGKEEAFSHEPQNCPQTSSLFGVWSY